MVKIIKGFTLVEVMIASALVGLLLVGVVGIFLSTVKGGNQAKMQADLKTKGDFVMSTMERTIRNAVKMPECSDVHTIVFSVKNDDGSVVDQQYAILNGSLLTTIDGITSSLISASDQKEGQFKVDDASAFSCYDGDAFNPGSVGIKMVLTVPDGQNQGVSQSFQTMVSIRNNP